eukprot:g2676.t1
MPCYDSYEAINAAFPGITDQDLEVVLIRGSSANLLSAPGKQLSSALNTALSPDAMPAAVPVVNGAIQYYFRYDGTLLDKLKGRYVAPPNADSTTATALAMFVPIRTSAAQTDIAAWVAAYRAKVARVASQYPMFSVVATGPITAQQVAGEATGKGFALTNGAGLPFIGLIFWWRVGSLRLLLLPAASTFLSLVVSYGVGRAVASRTTVPGFQPDIQLFLSLALSIDYSFFLLMRWREERLKGAGSDEAASEMMQHAGPVVLLSGSIVVITWLALCAFPVNGLVPVGYLSAATVFLAMLSNLTVTPALLLVFRRFFGRAGLNRRVRCCCCFGVAPCTCVMDRNAREVGDGLCCGREITAPSVGAVQLANPSAVNPVNLTGGAALAAPLLGVEAPASGHGAANGGSGAQRNCYFRLSRTITRWPWSVVVPCVVFACLIAGAAQLHHIRFTLFAATDFGSSSPTADAYAFATQQFRAVDMQPPFTVLAQAGALGIFAQPQFAEASCKLAQALGGTSGITLAPRGVFYNVTAAGLTCTNSTQAKEYWGNANASPQAAYYDFFARRAISQDNSSALVTFDVDFDPFTDSAALRTLVQAVRVVLGEHRADFAGGQLYVYSTFIQTVDAEHFTLHRFPAAIVITLVIIFVLVALRFRAAIVPFKLAATIVVPIFFIFGLAVTVFQDGTLDSLGWSAVHSDGNGGISWLLPCSTVFLLIGLALDYDIFLFSRVYELRRSGKYSDTEAISEAVAVSGPVISAAGVIMALAFAGMLANDDKFLNEFGFIAILGVLLDTFVVRTCLVPAILSLGGWINWWPAVMPEPAV